MTCFIKRYPASLFAGVRVVGDWEWGLGWIIKAVGKGGMGKSLPYRMGI
jgi:hypothetical protein